MLIKSVKTRLIKPKDSIFDIFAEKVHKLNDKSIIVIASKIVALEQNRVIESGKFQKVLQKEAEYISKKECCPGIRLTIKSGILIPNAGIDFSNIKKGKAILWPSRPQLFAEKFREQALAHYKIENLGVIIADSHCQPLRRGVTALALACAGFEPVRDERGKRDLFNNKLKVTQSALADGLATAANLLMGESIEKKPFAIIRKAPVIFTNRKIRIAELHIHPKKCLFGELYPHDIL